MNPSNSVQDHYTLPQLPERIENALREAGLDQDHIDWSALAPLDQFHVRGLQATRELAEKLEPYAGSRVLDIGSGLGGPARYLAAMHGCQVTGIELTPIFVEIANRLSARTGLADQVTCVQGDALELPFAEGSFDFAWTQHVAMNIADKAMLYKGIFRGLKKGGQFAIYDPVKGESAPVIYPVPWSQDGSISFLSSESELTHALTNAGFRITTSVDTTESAIAWLAQFQQAQPAPNPLSLGVIIGPNVQQATGNFARNIREDRVRLHQFIVEK